MWARHAGEIQTSLAPARPQKLSFRLNCNSRISVAVEVIFPKLELEKFEFGKPQLGWFGRLNASKRNSRLRRSVIGNSFMVEKSQLITPGPISVLRPELP